MDIEIFGIIIKNVKLFLLLIVILVIVMVTFFMWFAYITLLSKKRYQNKECKVENILAEETYKKSRKFFDFFLEAPTFFILLFVLLIIPFFFPLNIMIVMFLIITIIYFYFFPYIFKIIKKKSLVKLIDYLKKLKPDLAYSLIFFRDVWKIEGSDLKERFSTKQIEVWQVFAKKIDILFLDNKIFPIRIYLDNFYEFIDKRSLVFLTEPFFLSKILEWHFEISKKKYNSVLNNQKKINYQNDCGEILELLELIFLKIEKESLKTKEISSFFKIFKNYIKEKKEEIILTDNREEYYIKSIFILFLKEFYITVKSFSLEEKEKLWKKQFLPEWKVTIKNLKDEKNIIVNMAFNVFLYWAQERIWEDKDEKLDQEIDAVSKYLFPEVNSIMWDRILIFILTSRTTKNKVKSVIERPWKFSFVEEKYLSYYQDADELTFLRMKNIKINKTIELVFFLFAGYFTREKLQKYIKNLKNLKYEDSSKEFNKRLQFLTIFTKMLKILESKKIYSEEAIFCKDDIFYEPKITSFDLVKKELFELSHPILSEGLKYKKLKQDFNNSILLKSQKKEALSSGRDLKKLSPPKKKS